MTKALYKFDRFAGINNVDEPYRLSHKRDPVTYAVINDVADIVNMDIDNAHALITRPGYELKVSGTFMHSLWSDGNKCFFIDGSKLYQLQPDYSITEMLAGLTYGNRMSYALFNDRIYMTNSAYIGYFLNEAMHSLVAPGVNYKMPLPAGQHIALYLGRLLVARDNVLCIGDVLCDHYDIRTGYRVFEDRITMVRPVDNGGVYVSAGKTWFMGMGDEFNRKQVFDHGAVPYTDVLVGGDDVGDGVKGSVAVWTSLRGICVGDGSGTVKNITEDKYAMGDHGIGGAVIRNINGMKHYITTLE